MTALYRTRPAGLRERLICRLIGDLPIVANVTVEPLGVDAPRSILAGPGVMFDLGYEADVVGDAINAPPDPRGEEGQSPDRDTRNPPLPSEPFPFRGSLFGPGDIKATCLGLALLAIGVSALFGTGLWLAVTP